MKNIINKDSQLKVGDEIYAPKIDKYYRIVECDFNDEFKEVMLNIASTNRNPLENGFVIRLSGLISLGYYIIS